MEIVPINDLRRQFDVMGGPIRAAIESVVVSGRYLFGPHVDAFEAEFAEYCGVRHCCTVGNGTDAIELALRALECGSGTEVVTAANAGMYATSAIVAAGAQPVFADIASLSMTMAPAALAQAITERTRAVIVTHLYGRLADMEALVAVTSRCGIAVIEDCAQAHGAERAGRRAGAWGDAGCFSFYPTKNLGGLGDGGAVITSNARLADAIRALRQYGWSTKYHAIHPNGRNSRLDELQAAVLRVKLKHLDAGNRRRREIVQKYCACAPDSILVPDASGSDFVAHLCVVRTPHRDALRAHLKTDGIETEIHYPVPDHRQVALRERLPAQLSLPVTEQVATEILTIPSFPELSETEIDRICSSLARFGAECPR